MNDKWIEILNILPVWMIFVILLLLIIIPLIAESIRSFRTHKEFKINKFFIDEIKTHQSNIYKTLNVLLDVMYERYSNNLSFDVSIRLINIIYLRTSYYITEYIFNYFKDEDFKIRKIDISDLQNQLTTFIANLYHEDCMFLNKINCKGVNLDIHLSNDVNPKDISNKMIEIINQISEIRQSKNLLLTKYYVYKEVNKRTKIYFYTLINKCQRKLDNRVNKQIL